MYQNQQLNHVSYPLGGIGSGMICIDGNGGYSGISIRNKPEIFNNPFFCAALHSKDNQNNSIFKTLEGLVPDWKIMSTGNSYSSGSGARNVNWGYPRYQETKFTSQFPFATIELNDNKTPVQTTIKAWSPFTPTNSYDSSLPLAIAEYTFKNSSTVEQSCIFSFHTQNFLGTKEFNRVSKQTNGFMLENDGTMEKPWEKTKFSVKADDKKTTVNCRWHRGGWWDAQSIVARSIEDGTILEGDDFIEGNPSQGGSLYIPFTLKPGEEVTKTLTFSWFVPQTNIHFSEIKKDDDCCEESCDTNYQSEDYYQPWYAGEFQSLENLNLYWESNGKRIKEETLKFTEAFTNQTLPDKVSERVQANLSILKSPSLLRQKNGELWGWEGCHDNSGCCAGSCTHVFNYAQAICHLFPDLETSLRNTEFNLTQNTEGKQQFRADLPLQPSTKTFKHAAADGQLGGIMKIYRDWRISNDSEWIQHIWPKVKESLEYCIKLWDPEEVGALIQPHHNTYDIEFWGADGMCTSIYTGALKAAALIADQIEPENKRYQDLYQKSRTYMEEKLFNGEYFFQDPPSDESKKEAMNDNNQEDDNQLIKEEGPKYQYGSGVLSDGIIGAWMAEVCGIGEIINREMVHKHLLAIYKYNFKDDLSNHINPQRQTYALGDEGGLLLCSWPNGNKPTLPFVYSDEVWTGIEYQVASHLILMGEIEKGKAIVDAICERYNGTKRNPYNEFECGHWYVRAMASYSLIQGYTGIRYDAVDKKLYLNPQIQGDFSSFISTAKGYGLAGLKNNKPFINVLHGKIDVAEIVNEK